MVDRGTSSARGCPRGQPRALDLRPPVPLEQRHPRVCARKRLLGRRAQGACAALHARVWQADTGQPRHR
eukprot:2176875-Heterocapsa_arctica.AAC.1